MHAARKALVFLVLTAALVGAPIALADSSLVSRMMYWPVS
jgi:hypothetical protein